MGLGTVITFYSYKGGVGRTFVLANVGVLLASWGYRVLCIDWDLEAPGLTHYFSSKTQDRNAALAEAIGAPKYFATTHESQQLGLLELIEAFSRDGTANWRHFAVPVQLDLRGEMMLIPAGGLSDDYIERVQDIQWSALYGQHRFGAFLESMRTEWKNRFDFVLVDSRTGITDIGGICTTQLPDLLVTTLVANQQNLDGIQTVVKRARIARDRLPYDRGLLLTLPLVCRFDAREEYELGKTWMEKITAALTPLYSDWLSASVSVRDIIERTTIPYFSIWSFGENLPVLTEPRSPEYISFSLETVTALIAQRLANTDLLADSRDAYVASARRSAVQRGRFQSDVMISAPSDEATIAMRLGKALETRRISNIVVCGADSNAAEDAVTRSRHLLVLLSKTSEKRPEIEQFLKQAIDDQTDRIVFVGVLPKASLDQLPPVLRNLQTLPLLHDDVTEFARNFADSLSVGSYERVQLSSNHKRGPRWKRLAVDDPMSVDTAIKAVDSALPIFFAVAAYFCFTADNLIRTSVLGGALVRWIPDISQRFSLEGFIERLGGSFLPKDLLASLLTGILTYAYGRIAYSLIDARLSTPLLPRQQRNAFIANAVAIALLYSFTIDLSHLIGAATFGAIGATLLFLKLREPHW